MSSVFLRGLVGAIAGFCTRPCCAIPAAMSLTGVGGVGLAEAAVAYRPLFLSFSGMVLLAALWTTLGREGGTFNKALAVGATVGGFAVSLRMLGVM